jgi:hypothetical protein
MHLKSKRYLVLGIQMRYKCMGEWNHMQECIKKGVVTKRQRQVCKWKVLFVIGLRRRNIESSVCGICNREDVTHYGI